MASDAFASVQQWARGRAWLPRALVVAAMAWIGARVTADPGRWTLFSPIDLGLHEAGHLLMRPFGQVLCAFGGTLLQCLAPVFAAIVLARRDDWFGVAFCGFWLGLNLHEVSHYMADARAMVLQLVTVGGGEAKHDWNFLLGRFGLLRSDRTLAGLVRVLGFLVTWVSILASGGLVLLIRRESRGAGSTVWG